MHVHFAHEDTQNVRFIVKSQSLRQPSVNLPKENDGTIPLISYNTVHKATMNWNEMRPGFAVARNDWIRRSLKYNKRQSKHNVSNWKTLVNQVCTNKNVGWAHKIISTISDTSVWICYYQQIHVGIYCLRVSPWMFFAPGLRHTSCETAQRNSKWPVLTSHSLAEKVGNRLNSSAAKPWLKGRAIV